MAQIQDREIEQLAQIFTTVSGRTGTQSDRLTPEHMLLALQIDLLHFRASLSILTAFFLTCHTGPARSTNNGKRMYVKDFMPCKVLQNGTTLRFGYF